MNENILDHVKEIRKDYMKDHISEEVAYRSLKLLGYNERRINNLLNHWNNQKKNKDMLG